MVGIGLRSALALTLALALAPTLALALALTLAPHRQAPSTQSPCPAHPAGQPCTYSGLVVG